MHKIVGKYFEILFLFIGFFIQSLSDFVAPKLCPSKGLVDVDVMPVKNSSNGRAFGTAFDKFVLGDLFEDIEVFVEELTAET